MDLTKAALHCASSVTTVDIVPAEYNYINMPILGFMH